MMAMTGVCPDCGTPLPKDAALMGLCPQCLLSMALEDEEPETLHGHGPGGILGERYQIREVLGRGGMGEVYRAFDLKLRVDVALKAVRPELSESEKARELLRQEVRSAREVLSPNVCRIFDLVVEEGRELVSMEYIDGSTLAETLRERRPLELQEAREVAAQFLSGLEAIHEAGLVHRDFKPENVMLTRAGRVVVMDFGLAKARTEGKSRTIAGTPAYMSPEQSRGEPVDARSDVFSAGVVLAEMLTAGPRDEIWQAVREVPPQVPEGPWAPVLRQALAADRESRHPTARALARALDEVTHRLPGFEDKHPYPGLASFNQEDAEYFFGREMEVEGVWKKMKRPRLLALIGPSGAGKSSFLRAGLLPTLPQGWRVVLSIPGSRPFQALAQALIPAFSGDTHGTEALFRFEDPVALLSKWRQKSEHALVIVDQFEELFTLNPPEVQEAFATLIGKLVLEADVHVLLSLRDDFLFHCQKHDALSPVFSELTPLGRLSPSALRRALVQPALACGYRFEDEALVEEMVSEVSHERGVLPLLAFAASRLWEKRDRENGLLTREAYQEIGGVGGALAQHAEETLDRIGAERTPIVRELFRNLVTAQGTRASRDVQELLSIFPDEGERRAAEEVLRELVAARLLTAYETSVEIIHESLLSAWPRLVRWQTQDADGAQLRDQLRQAAQVWQDRGRPDDLLWTGSSYRELALWRERYTGGLSTTEEEFASTTTAHAQRRRRRRRLAIAAVVAGLTIGLVAFAGLWRKASSEGLRAEASKLLALGQVELEPNPTAALAYAIKSLELADTQEARRFALRVLSGAPTATLRDVEQESVLNAHQLAFSPNGEWLALGGIQKGQLFHRDGRDPLILPGEYPSRLGGFRLDFSRRGDLLLTDYAGEVRLWSMPDAREVQKKGAFEEGSSNLFSRGEGFFTSTTVGEKELIRWWPLGEGESRLIGTTEALGEADVDTAGTRFAYSIGQRVYVRSLENWDSPPRVMEHPARVYGVAFHPDGNSLAASDKSGEIRIWTTTGSSDRPLRVLNVEGVCGLRYSPGGRWLAALCDRVDGVSVVDLWDLSAPPGAKPVVLMNDRVFLSDVKFDPAEEWLVTAESWRAAFWPLGESYPRVLQGHEAPISSVAFTPDGTTLLSASNDGTLRSWPLQAGGTEESRVLLRDSMFFPGLDVDSTGTRVVVSGTRGHIVVVPLAGGPARELEGFSERAGRHPAVAFSPDGRRVAGGTGGGPPEEKVIRIWDLESGGVRVLGPVPGAAEGFEGGVNALAFLGEDRLLATNSKGLLSFDLRDGRVVVLSPEPNGGLALSRTGSFGFGTHWDEGGLFRFDLGGNAQTTLSAHGENLTALALDSTEGVIATGSDDGIVRVGPVSGGEPHLLFGHKGMVRTIAFSPDGRWLASAGEDRTIRIWPVPDVTKTPPHKRSHEEFLSKLRSWTNLRVVPDPASSTGWKLEIGPFPGWAKQPES